MPHESGMSAELDDAARTRWFLKHILPHEQALRAWLSRGGKWAVDVDDVIQETYAVFANMPRLDGIRNPRAYLFQVAKSQVVRSLRSAKVVPIVAIEDLAGLEVPDTDPTPERWAIQREDLRRLAESIAAMPERTREAFVLRRVRGLPQRSIAERMGVSESTVEKHIANGLRVLAERFRDGGNDVESGSRKAPPADQTADAAPVQPDRR